eukprot:352616-Chlamydomonas_euryale.AAC.14
MLLSVAMLLLQATARKAAQQTGVWSWPDLCRPATEKPNSVGNAKYECIWVGSQAHPTNAKYIGSEKCGSRGRCPTIYWPAMGPACRRLTLGTRLACRLALCYGQPAA